MEEIFGPGGLIARAHPEYEHRPGQIQMAEAVLRAFEELRARRSSEGNVSVVKEAMAQLGMCGRAVRAPISELSDSEREEVAAILLEWAL